VFKIGLSTCSKEINEKLFYDYSKNGIEYMEIAISNGDNIDFDYKKVYNLSEKYNIKLWSYHLPIIPFYELDLSNPHMCDGAIKHFCTLMEKVADIGVKTFVVHPSVEPINDSDRPGRIECSKHSIARLSQFAKKLGAVVAVEDLPRSCLGNCSGEIKELISLDDSLGVCFDTNHLPKEDPVDFIHAIGDKIITTHISDYDFADEKHWMPGEGKNNWYEIYKALNEVGYKGPWLYEVGFSCPDTITRSRDLGCADFAKNANEIFENKQLTVLYN